METKEYKLRKHVSRWVWVLILIRLIPASIVTTYALFTDGGPFFRIFGDQIGSVLGMGAFFVLEFTILLWASVRISRIRVRLSDDGVAWVSGRKIKEISFSEITEVKVSSIPYIVGQLTLRSGKLRIGLSTSLKGIQEIVRKVKERLDQLGRADVYDEDELFKLYKTAASCDQRWDRLYRVFWKLALVAAACGVLGGLMGYSAVDRWGDRFLWCVLPFAYPFLIWAIPEFFLGRIVSRFAIAKTFKCARPREEYVKKLYRKAADYGFDAYLGLIFCAWLIAAMC